MTTITVTLNSQNFEPNSYSLVSGINARNAFTTILTKLIETNIQSDATIEYKWTSDINAQTMVSVESDTIPFEIIIGLKEDIEREVRELVQIVWDNLQTNLSFTFWDLGAMMDFDELLINIHEIMSTPKYKALVNRNCANSERFKEKHVAFMKAYNELVELTENAYDTLIDK